MIGVFLPLIEKSWPMCPTFLKTNVTLPGLGSVLVVSLKENSVPLTVIVVDAVRAPAPALSARAATSATARAVRNGSRVELMTFIQSLPSSADGEDALHARSRVAGDGAEIRVLAGLVEGDGQL